MGKYSELSRRDGNSKWFLQRTLTEHDRSMDHPWMMMIYNQSFSVKQYSEWLARMYAAFQAMEAKGNVIPEEVNDPTLLRTAALEADLQQLIGSSWRTDAEEMIAQSPATQQYLAHLSEDATDPLLFLCHHFLQYNAVLSGGAFLGDMVSKKFCLPHGVAGVKLYAFDGVDPGKEPARVQRYLKDFDKIDISDEYREKMLVSMRNVYEDTEAMMQECYQINPLPGVAYSVVKGAEGENINPVLPEEEMLGELSLSELHGFTGADGGRIVISIAGELIDVSAGRELYGPGGGYSLLAGRDVSRCLGTMSLDPAVLDDLRWEPDDAEDEKALNNWREKLKAKYPVAGKLRADAAEIASQDGLRQRGETPATGSTAAATTSPESTTAADADSQRCPISGKEGVGCPMAMIGIDVTKKKPKAKAAPQADPAKPPSSGGKTGFTAGKSLIADVVQQNQADDQESFIWKLCPLHWDDNTTRLLIVVAASAWISGIFVGWNLHKQLMT